MFLFDSPWYLMISFPLLRIWRRARSNLIGLTLFQFFWELVTEEDFDLAKLWLFPDADIGDISMQDTIITKQTRIPDAANGSTLICSLVPFESCSLLHSDNLTILN
jgi:hypothetical protein